MSKTLYVQISALGLLSVLLGAAWLLDVEFASALTREVFLFGSLIVSSIFGYLRISSIIREQNRATRAALHSLAEALVDDEQSARLPLRLELLPRAARRGRGTYVLIESLQFAAMLLFVVLADASDAYGTVTVPVKGASRWATATSPLGCSAGICSGSSGSARTCESRWSCFTLWMGCEGDYVCPRK